MHGRDRPGERGKLQIVTGSLSPTAPAGMARQRPSRRWWREPHVLVVGGAALGVPPGALLPDVAVELKPLGDVFISLIKMTIAPLIFLVVVTGIAQVGDMRAVGRIGLKALIYFEAVTTLCLLFSFIVVQRVQPG